MTRNDDVCTIVHDKEITSFKEETTMLVLSRKFAEELRISGDITIKVVGISGNRVRLGINAPEHVEIFRQEVYEQRELLLQTEIPSEASCRVS